MMIMHSRNLLFLSFSLMLSLCAAADDLNSLPEKAVQRSKLTQSGAKPFHLKAVTDEQTNVENDQFNGTIEEWWAAPDRYKQVVTTPVFTDVIVVNGEKHSEQFTGTYYPIWMRTLVDAIFDPDKHLKGVQMGAPKDNPMIGGLRTCRRLTIRAGIAPVSNNVFEWFCFKDGLIDDIGAPGYHAEYLDYKKFGDLKVARNVREYIESGTTAEARIEVLESWTEDSNSLQAGSPTPALRIMQVSEQTLRKMNAANREIDWPVVRSGKTKGSLSVYLGIDREGHVQEIYGLNSDNPDVTDAVVKQLRTWQFTPAATAGERVQVEGIMTFAFNAQSKPLRVFNNDEARKLALNSPNLTFPPNFAPSGTPVLVEARFRENGELEIVLGASDLEHQLKGYLAPNKMAQLWPLITDTMKKWRFAPYIEDAKPSQFKVEIVFRVP